MIHERTVILKKIYWQNGGYFFASHINYYMKNIKKTKNYLSYLISKKHAFVLQKSSKTFSGIYAVDPFFVGDIFGELKKYTNNQITSRLLWLSLAQKIGIESKFENTSVMNGKKYFIDDFDSDKYDIKTDTIVITMAFRKYNIFSNFEENNFLYLENIMSRNDVKSLDIYMNKSTEELELIYDVNIFNKNFKLKDPKKIDVQSFNNAVKMYCEFIELNGLDPEYSTIAWSRSHLENEPFTPTDFTDFTAAL